MKKLFYASVCLLFICAFHLSKASAQTISSYYDMGTCASPTDSMTLMEAGYVGPDSIIVSWGDGTTDTVAPIYSYSTTAYYDPSHTYGGPGTYTKKIVLVSAGVSVDSVTYTYVYDPCNIMYVRFYSDNNSNCSYDAGDTYLYSGPAYTRVDSAGVPVDTIVSNWGIYYQATGPVGTVYTFTVYDDPAGYVHTCPGTGAVSFTITSTYGYHSDSIGFECDPTACLDNAISANFRASLTAARGYMYFSTTSCTPITTTATMTFSPKYALSSVYGASYTVSGNVITFTVTGLSHTSSAWVSAYFTPVGTPTLGDTVHTTFAVSTSGDCDVTNNTVFTIDTIRASFDPNHKSVEPVGYITAGTKMEYMLQFENTGNDVAHNIHLMDTLSDNLDINTIQQISSSHACQMILTKWAGHNVVKFDFPNIELLDSSHHGLCDGFVSYTINAKSTLTAGAIIDNRAGIYFDINEVVMTNSVRNSIPIPTGIVTVSNSGVELYPNPVSDLLTIKTVSGTYSTVTVTNTLGQVIMSRPVDDKQTTVSVKSLPAGIYYITLRGQSGVKVQKFEKL